MQVAVFSAKPYDREFFDAALGEASDIQFSYFDVSLQTHTRHLARGFDAVCVFVNDCLDASVLQTLAEQGARLICLRCAGFNNVDLRSADNLGLTVLRVPAYSPHAVAEHAVALMLTLNRKTHRAYNRIREGNFLLTGLLGFDMVTRTIGIIGTGRIGSVLAQIMRGFGCRVLAHDLYPNPACAALGVEYVDLEALYAQADIVSLNCPLTPETTHLINAEALAKMKRGVMIINTGRGALIDTQAVIDSLKSGQIGYLGLDVYEQEEGLFFEDFSCQVIQDDLLQRLMTFPNVLITGHQGFFTEEALTQIAAVTLANIRGFVRGVPPADNLVPVPQAV